MKKEFTKIGNLKLAEESSTKLHTIAQLLDEYEASILIDVANATGSFSEVDSPQYTSVLSQADENSLIERIKNLQVNSPAPSRRSSKCDDVEEVSWEKLEGPNLDVFNGIDAELSLYKEPDHFSNVLTFLRSSVDDYPAEFFLQPPNVLESLIDILTKVSTEHSIEIVGLIRFIVNGLKDRWLSFLKTENDSFASVNKHLNDILSMITNYFEQFHDSFDSKFFQRNQSVLNEIYLLLFDAAMLIKATQNVCELKLNDLLNMIAKVAKDLRLSYASNKDGCAMIRLHYLVCIYVINVMVASIDVGNIIAHSENNNWAFESDVALLDVPLKMAHPVIYNLIEDNRRDSIPEDVELCLLLDAQKHFKPVVEIFQNFEQMSDEEIILHGVKALDTIRIHRSLELIDLLMTTINRSSAKLSHLCSVKEASEEIILRLLSIEIPNVRQFVYKFAHKFVQQKLQDSADTNSSAKNLCNIFGIPITVEIVTEILCFGFTDSDATIHSHVRLILFALLRSKVCFSHHWEEILQVILPILPLMTCLISIDEKIGMFAFDIFQSHSCFDELELNKAFARFLYCDDKKARKLAMRKLLTRLPFPDDYIVIIPDDFCIVPSGLVTDLQLPDSKVGFDTDAYETLSEVLRTVDRTNAELLKSILIQLSVMMNSKEFCEKTHDDNLWVHFMVSLDFGFPHDDTIRRLTISILYKWVVCVPDFRVYFSNKEDVFTFLIETLVYFHNDVQLKKQASCMLFLLLFSDFVVPTDKSISMPKLFEKLCCPFKFEQHWTESPFNKFAPLEQLHEAVEASSDVADTREISQKSFRFSFALEWFKGGPNVMELETCNYFYGDLSDKTMCVANKLRLNQGDLDCIRHTVSNSILRTLCREMDSARTIQSTQDLILQTRTLLLLPVTNKDDFGELLGQRIERWAVLSGSPTQRKMIFGFLEIYQKIMKWLKNDRISNIINKSFIAKAITTSDTTNHDAESLVEIFKLVNCVVKLCESRPELSSLLIKTFEKHHNVYLPSSIVERMSKYLFEDKSADNLWRDVNERPVLKSILMLLQNVLRIMPNQLDDQFLTQIFDKILARTMPLYRGHHDHIKATTQLHIHSSIMKYIFGIAEQIASLVNHVKLTKEHYKTLMFWSRTDQRKNKSLPLMIIGHLTKNKEDFDSFCNNFENKTGMNFFYFVITSCLNSRKPHSHDQNAAAIIIGNILEFDTLTNSKSGINLNSLNFTIKQFLDSGNISALAFIIRRMVQCDIQGTAEIVLKYNIINQLLTYKVPDSFDLEAYKKIAEQFETIGVCQTNKFLNDHVNDVVTNESTADFMFMFADTNTMNKPILKNFNLNAFNHMLNMIQSEVGLLRICQTMTSPQVILPMMLASHENLRISNPHSLIMFQLRFWNSLIDASIKFTNPCLDLIATQRLRHLANEFTLLEPADKTDIKFLTTFQQHMDSVKFGIDFLFLQTVSIFEFSFTSKLNSECKF